MNHHEPEDWTKGAVCASSDPETFFPEEGFSNAKAKAMCLSCPAVDACEQWAIDHDERHGIWGGKSAEERREDRHKTRVAARAA
jgi:WhiB family redox-sensing transcriptional regulator